MSKILLETINLKKTYQYDKSKDQLYTNWIFANSFDGIISDMQILAAERWEIT